MGVCGPIGQKKWLRAPQDRRRLASAAKHSGPSFLGSFTSGETGKARIASA
jgi:hypothetical protein